MQRDQPADKRSASSSIDIDPSGVKWTETWKEAIEENPQQAKKDAARLNLTIQNSPLKYELINPDGPNEKIWTKTLSIPKLFTRQDQQIFDELCAAFYTIFEKTIKAYKTDPKVRGLFGFDPKLEELVMRNPDYQTVIPMLRVDIFYDENTKDWQVCEFNTDGTSAMFENDTIYRFLQDNSFYQKLHPKTEYMELTEKWADAFLQIWKESGREAEPSIVITDILENAYLPELKAFVGVFKNRGLVCELEDIRNLDYDGKSLYSRKTGTRYNMVYRRAVTRDVMSHYEELAPFIQAIKDDAALLVGDFQTQIVHSKMINEALQSDVLRMYFTPQEIEFLDAHMPWTGKLDGDMVEQVIADKDRWIIKPKDSYAAKGVWAGVDVSQKLWEKLVRDCQGDNYIVQTYIHHFKTPNIDPLESPEFKNFSNMSGLYVYNGKFAGVYSRLADAGIISTQYNEKMVPTLFLTETDED